MTRICRIALAVALLSAASHGGALANEASLALRARATAELYNLDDERAIASYRAATVADPQDAAAYRGLASAILIRVAMLRGTMTVDSYLERVSSNDVRLPVPPPELAREFRTVVERAITLGREKVAARPRDPQAHYELGAAVGLKASFIASVEGGVVAAFRSAREAFNEHETVLELQPARADAGLVVGTYRYLVASLSLPMRWMAYMVGFGGGREQGVRMVERAAGYPGENQSESRIALLLLYTRERRFDDALTQIGILRDRYPRNRLLLLEAGSAYLRANRPAEAERVLDEGMTMLAGDTRPRMFGEEALWYYRRGSARVALGRAADARGDLDKALAVEGRAWVHGRAHLELGRLDLQARDMSSARVHLQAAERLCNSDRDARTASRARELMQQATPPR